MTALAAIPDSPLDQLAREVRSEHNAAQSAWESAVHHAHRAGQCLLEAKALCKHGEWLPWLRDVGIPRRTATEYMRFAKRADPAHLPATISEALEAVEDRERRSHQATMQTLSAEFDRAMKPASPLTPYVPVRRYRELSCENPDWAWKRVKAHVQEFTAVIYDMPPVPPKTDAAKELRAAVARLHQLLGDTPAPPSQTPTT